MGNYERYVFYDLRSDLSKIINVLNDLSEGKGQKAIQRTTGVYLETQRRWLLKVADHTAQINEFLEKIGILNEFK